MRTVLFVVGVLLSASLARSFGLTLWETWGVVAPTFLAAVALYGWDDLRGGR